MMVVVMKDGPVVRPIWFTHTKSHSFFSLGLLGSYDRKEYT